MRGWVERGPGSSTESVLCPRFLDPTEPSWLKTKTVRVKLLLPEVWPELNFREDDADVCCRDGLRVLQASSDLGQGPVGL